jgi:uncharacterized membrane protein
MTMRRVAVCLFLLLAGASSPAFAVMKYCNNFKYDIHIALAFETNDGFTSEGWTGIKANTCWEDKDIVPPFTFYYHAETDAIPAEGGKTWTWGEQRAFSVLNKPFKIKNAEFKAKGGRFAEFNGPYTLGAKNGLAEITFGDGTASVSLSVK